MREKEKRFNELCSDTDGFDGFEVESCREIDCDSGDPEDWGSSMFRTLAASKPSILDEPPQDREISCAGIDPEIDRMIPEEHVLLGDMSLIEQKICELSRSEDSEPDMLRGKGPILVAPEASRYYQLKESGAFLGKDRMIDLVAGLMRTYIVDDNYAFNPAAVERVYARLVGNGMKESEDRPGAVFKYIIGEVPSWKCAGEIYRKETVFKVVDSVMKLRWSVSRKLDSIVDSFPASIDRDEAQRMLVCLLRERKEPLARKQGIYNGMKSELWRAKTGRDSYSRNEVLEVMKEYFI
ncbi:PqqD family protein [Candidatus Woesearchaeota archaeon]|nr:PqqD family protein [Candidatus Woesearchaeota archaeon]